MPTTAIIPAGARKMVLPITYGPDISFVGHLIVKGSAHNRTNHCDVRIFRSTRNRYVVYGTWLNIEHQHQPPLREAIIIDDIKELVTILRDKTRDRLFIAALKDAMKRGGVEAVISV